MVFDLKISAKHLEAQATRPPNGQACWRVGQARGKARMPDWVGIYLPLSRGASLEQSLPCRQPRAAVAKLAGHRGINGAPGLMRQQCRWLASCESLSVCRSRAVQLTAMDARACCLVPNSSLSQQLQPRCAHAMRRTTLHVGFISADGSIPISEASGKLLPISRRKYVCGCDAHGSEFTQDLGSHCAG